jgi:hypothetical protein
VIVSHRDCQGVQAPRERMIQSTLIQQVIITLKIYCDIKVGYMYIIIDRHVLTDMTVAPTEQMQENIVEFYSYSVVMQYVLLLPS